MQRAGAALAFAPAASAAKMDAQTTAILDVFAKRQTVRRYRSDPVPEEHVTAILDAARRAPTCMNQQPWKFLVIRDKDKIARMKTKTLEGITAHFQKVLGDKPTVTEKDRQSYEQAVSMTEGYFTAPVYVVVLTDNECPCGIEYNKHDGPLAAGYLMLAARALGYGTAYLTDGIPEKVTREVLAIPARWSRVCITPIGVPDKWPEPKPKKKLEDLVAYETLA
jgi:nitroreductase